MMKITFGVVLALFCASCSNSTSQDSKRLVGTWLQPIPGQDGTQGIKLDADGTAQSINMATLQYTAWSMADGNLVLNGKSIGNGTESDFSDTLGISLVTDDSLHLIRGKVTLKFGRTE